MNNDIIQNNAQYHMVKKELKWRREGWKPWVKADISYATLLSEAIRYRQEKYDQNTNRRYW